MQRHYKRRVIVIYIKWEWRQGIQNNLVALKFNRPRHCGVYRINFMSLAIVAAAAVVATVLVAVTAVGIYIRLTDYCHFTSFGWSMHQLMDPFYQKEYENALKMFLHLSKAWSRRFSLNSPRPWVFFPINSPFLNSPCSLQLKYAVKTNSPHEFAETKFATSDTS